LLLRICFFLQYYNAWVSLSGTLLCIAVMFLMSWVMALITFVVVVTLYLYVSYRKPGMLANTWMKLIQVSWVFALRITVIVFWYFEGMYHHYLWDWGSIHPIKIRAVHAFKTPGTDNAASENNNPEGAGFIRFTKFTKIFQMVSNYLQILEILNLNLSM
jgi:energy-coupling factor transporter transmembrane protein EcfT